MKLSRIKHVIACGAVAAALTGATSMTALAEEFVSVSKDGVNVRSGPDTTYEILYELPEGYPLKVLSRKGQWLKVSDADDDKGWIYDTLVANTPYVIVISNECNVRSGPGTDKDKVGSVLKDVILKKEETQGEWIRISHSQINGWIHKSLVWP